jgi:prevent-host-death family protein
VSPVEAAMQTVNIHAAKTHLSRLVDAAAAGEEILIARAGRPVARLVPLHEAAPAPRRRLGQLAGQVRVPADFDAPLPEDVQAGFERG